MWGLVKKLTSPSCLAPPGRKCETACWSGNTREDEVENPPGGARPPSPGEPGPDLGECPNSGELDLDKHDQGTACGAAGGVKRRAWLGWGGPGRPPSGDDG